MPSALFEKAVCGFFALLFVVYVAIFLFVPVHPPNFAWGLSSLGLPAFELTFFCVLTLGLWRLRKSWLRYLVVPLSILVPAVIGTFYLVQLISVILSGQYISVLALENATEAAYVTNPVSLVLTLCFGALVLALIAALVHDLKTRCCVRAGALPALLTFGIFIGMGALYSERNKMSSVALDTDLAPALQFHATVKDFGRVRDDSQAMIAFQDAVANGTVTAPFNFDMSAEFPLQHETLPSVPLPFDHSAAPSQPLNVIIVFLEGLSARALNHYGGPFADLTPNIDGFAQNALSVDGYFNHTAATYRGLLGSLASAFPAAGGVDMWESSDEAQGTLSAATFSTLPTILEARGYQTRFFSPHREHKPFDEFLEFVGFEDVHTMEDIEGDGSQGTHLSDKALFEHMTANLKERDQTPDAPPFFWASYNLGSHAFYDVPDGAKRYGDGRNAALNRFHELDASLKPFLDAFNASELAKNTLLILTSDHSAFAEPAVVQAFSGTKNFTQHFVDQIPLLMHLPGDVQPMRYQNGVRTSLDLAPTVLHLLGYKDVDHAFLGTSVFDETVSPDTNWAAIGRAFFRLNSDGVTRVEPPLPSTEQVAIDAIKYFYHLEANDKIFLAGDSTRD
ncbi:MAG: LTA synthase family protein [Paracoccaceae bacterium]